MKASTLLTFTTVALLSAGSAMACNRDKDRSPGDSSDSVREVRHNDRDSMRRGHRGFGDMRQARHFRGHERGAFAVGHKPGDDMMQVQNAEPGQAPAAEERPEQRPQRGEPGERGPRGERGARGQAALFQDLGFSEEQQEQFDAIIAKMQEQLAALRERVQNARENGDEIDREAMRERTREISTTAFQSVYTDVLTDEQRATVDQRREEMEQRRAERRQQRERGEGAEGGPQRRGGEGGPAGEGGERPQRRGGAGGGNDDLDL